MTGQRRRVTQQDIARMTGVSQAAVSVVLNGRFDSEVRIAPETRERVLRAITETGYVADPVARRLAAGRNRIIGVFTYEPMFPAATGDFYHPFLVAIEQRAESLGCDLLLFTSAPVVDGRRRIFHEGNRLRLADGCILLGRSLDRGELAQLVADGLPFVSIGRRDDVDGPIPYVGGDYSAATLALVRRAAELGHTRLAYFGIGAGPESWADRLRGFHKGVKTAGIDAAQVTPDGHLTRLAGDPVPTSTVGAEIDGSPARDHQRVLEAVTAHRITAVFAEDHADGVALYELAHRRGIDLSVVTLGEPMRAATTSGLEFSGFHVPRHEMAAQAIEVLNALIEGSPTQTQRLLSCEVVAGQTLTERKQDAG